MTAEKSRPGQGAAIPIENRVHSIAAPTGARLSPGVLEVIVTNTRTARTVIVNATSELDPGAHVRLVVGRTLPPLWLETVIRLDVTYQVVARTAKALDLWTFALRYGSAS